MKNNKLISKLKRLIKTYTKSTTPPEYKFVCLVDDLEDLVRDKKKCTCK